MSAGAPDTPPVLRLALDGPAPERELARLVLTLVELLRRLLEAQSLRRLEAGSLGAPQAERLGLALAQLDGAMEGLCARLGLRREELNLDLGPLGRLL